MTISSNATMQSKMEWMDVVSDDLQQVVKKMQDVSFLDNQLLDAAVDMILTAGGKRVRPSLTLLIGRALGADYDKVISVAASVELLHTATLVHDDLVDDAPERRGVATLHTQLPLGVTVLTGDFLFAQAAALAAEADSVRIVQVFADTLVSICKGEILQAQTRWHVPDRETYDKRIYGKTAALYEAAALSGAIIGSPAQEKMIQAFAAYGRELGMAFQIVDDALDFTADTTKLGKPAGHDLRQGHITLPTMYYLDANGTDHDTFIEQISDEGNVDEVVQAIRAAKMPQQALQDARGHIDNALEALESLNEWAPELDHLQNLAQYVVDRDF
jgi:geranylgeranyl pyrophosphate synthase